MTPLTDPFKTSSLMDCKFLKLLVATFLCLLTVDCSRVSTPEPTQIQYGGACSDDFSKAYEAILNWTDNPDLQAACDDFYAKYSDVKCMSKINGVELRLHTTDFDKKCQKNRVSDKNKADKSSEPTTIKSEGKSLCSRDLTAFLADKQNEFNKATQDIFSNSYSDDQLFDTALAKKKICNQYFFNYNYLECTRDNKAFSFNTIKPYCDQFQGWLQELKLKNPKKYSPEELKPIAGVSLKFHFVDPILPFFKSSVKIKDTYLVDGKSLPFNEITSSQNYCYFESDRIRYAGELKNQLYKVDVTISSKSRVLFAYNSFNEQWRLVCHVAEFFYLQDLLETLGEHVSTIE